ncbi:Hsp70 family protein [Corynebacterium sp. 335C]
MTWHLAIDYGTSNTAAAHAEAGGKPAALTLSRHGALLPSSVHLRDGELATGDEALAGGAADPAGFLPSPKRVIDHDRVPLGGSSVEVADAVAAVLRRVIASGAERHGGAAPTTVTLTHPEAWPPGSVARLRAAAVAAGVDEDAVLTISEPRAAAHFYAARAAEGGDADGTGADGVGAVADGDGASADGAGATGRVAVFDFGAGTLDVAVLEPDGAGHRVVAARGDNSLGGRTVDALVRAWALDQLERDEPQLAEYLDSAPPSVAMSLDGSVRQAKEILSDAASATVTVSTPLGEADLLLTRDEFESLLAPEIDRAVDLTRAVLRDAGVDGPVPLYLVGGSSAIPMVQDRLGEVGRVATLDDPKTVVARGALRAAMDGAAADASGLTAPGVAGAAGSGAAAAGAGAGAASAAGGGTGEGDGAKPRASRGRVLALSAVAASVAAIAIGAGAGAMTADDTVEWTAAETREPVPGLPESADATVTDEMRTALEYCTEYELNRLNPSGQKDPGTVFDCSVRMSQQNVTDRPVPWSPTFIVGGSTWEDDVATFADAYEPLGEEVHDITEGGIRAIAKTERGGEAVEILVLYPGEVALYDDVRPIDAGPDLVEWARDYVRTYVLGEPPA